MIVVDTVLLQASGYLLRVCFSHVENLKEKWKRSSCSLAEWISQAVVPADETFSPSSSFIVLDRSQTVAPHFVFVSC